MARRRSTPRGRRRADERRARELSADLERLARLAPGGTPEHPIEVASPVQVDARAETTPCPLCGGALELDDHVAETVAGRRLRIARCHCLQCGAPREIHFRLRSPLQS